MVALKHVNTAKAAKAQAAWARWMREEIRVPSPDPADLDAIPPEIAAAAMLYQLPPGWRWIGDEPKPPEVPGDLAETGPGNRV